jgi:hypothetical protein
MLHAPPDRTVLARSASAPFPGGQQREASRMVHAQAQNGKGAQAASEAIAARRRLTEASSDVMSTLARTH